MRPTQQIIQRFSRLLTRQFGQLARVARRLQLDKQSQLRIRLRGNDALKAWAMVSQSRLNQ